MSLELYATYVVACIVIILVPGPTVTLIIANSIRHGSRAGLANVAGTQAGLAIMIAIVGIGLNTLIAGMGHWFEWVRLIGAAYLIWMGVQMFRAKGALNPDGSAKKPRGGFSCKAFSWRSAIRRPWCSSAPSSRSSSRRRAITRCRSWSWA